MPVVQLADQLLQGVQVGYLVRILGGSRDGVGQRRVSTRGSQIKNGEGCVTAVNDGRISSGRCAEECCKAVHSDVVDPRIAGGRRSRQSEQVRDGGLANKTGAETSEPSGNWSHHNFSLSWQLQLWMLEDLSEGGIKQCEPRCGNVPLTRKEEFRSPRLCRSACESKRVIDRKRLPQ